LEPYYRTGCEVARLIACGALSPVEAVEASLARLVL
jgi:hypothetical protein